MVLDVAFAQYEGKETYAVEYPKEEIAERYSYRWNVELDIRHIKQTLNMDHFRCKAPKQVEVEFWVTLLGYNFVRKVMCEAATFCFAAPFVFHPNLLAFF